MRNDNKWTHRTEVQKIQQIVSRKVADYAKNDEEDKALIVAYLGGNEEAGVSLLKNYLDFISNIYLNPYNPPRMGGAQAKSMRVRPPAPNLYDKEDLLQEIIYHFFKLVEEYDESFELPFQALIKGKLFLRFHNNFYREFFEIKKSELEFEEELDNDFSYKASIMIEEKQPSDYMELYEAFNQLNPKERAVIECIVVKGWNATETAKELGLEGNIRMIKTRALRKLREIMKKDVA